MLCTVDAGISEVNLLVPCGLSSSPVSASLQPVTNSSDTSLLVTRSAREILTYFCHFPLGSNTAQTGGLDDERKWNSECAYVLLFDAIRHQMARIERATRVECSLIWKKPFKLCVAAGRKCSISPGTHPKISIKHCPERKKSTHFDLRNPIDLEPDQAKRLEHSCSSLRNLTFDY